MKKFKYRIESFLKFSIFERTRALKDFQETQNYKNTLEKNYRYLENEMSQAYERNSQLGKQIRDVHFINDNNSFILKLKEQMKSLSQEIMIAEEELRKKMSKLKEAQVKVRKLELHKEIEKEKYIKKEKKKLQNKLDEINASRRWG